MRTFSRVAFTGGLAVASLALAAVPASADADIYETAECVVTEGGNVSVQPGGGGTISFPSITFGGVSDCT